MSIATVRCRTDFISRARSRREIRAAANKPAKARKIHTGVYLGFLLKSTQDLSISKIHTWGYPGFLLKSTGLVKSQIHAGAYQGFLLKSQDLPKNRHSSRKDITY